MLRKILGFIAVIGLLAMGHSLLWAEDDLETQVADQNKRIEELTVQLKVLEGQMTQLKKDYIAADIKLRGELLKETEELTKSVGDRQAHKSMVSKAKEGQANLRRDYYQKKKPIASQMDELKTQIAGCNRKMKELEAKIKNIKEGTQDEIYTVQMQKLKQQLVQLKQERDASLAQLESDTTQKISAITEITDRRLKRKEIISQAQDARVQIWQTYNSKKEEIDKLIHTAKKEHNQRMEEAAWQKAQERKLEAEKEKSETKAQNISVEKGPTCNFEHR